MGEIRNAYSILVGKPEVGPCEHIHEPSGFTISFSRTLLHGVSYRI
jgi:hypothetical protein